MFAPLAFSRAMSQPKHGWQSTKFSNSRAEMEVVLDDTSDEEEYEEEIIFDQAPVTSIYAPVPQYGGYDPGYAFDPRLRRVTSSSFGESSAPVPVLNTVVNPVENLSQRIPMPTVMSPIDKTDVAGTAPPQHDPNGGHPESDSTCCGPYIAHHELRHTRELLGLNQAQRSRYGRSAGEGVSLQEDEERVAHDTHFGPVATSDPLYTAELYDQGFVSMSAVPSVFVGVYTDPVTGEEFDAYESAMPPPDADYEETLNSSGRNVKLAHLQGGWRDTTPKPTKTEVLEDDFHMQYDRTINTFGTYDPSYYMEVIEHNNRFKHDDHHPDPDGPVIVGLPANTLGNQGDVKIRPMPYVKPTNRGKWAETTFRAGIDPSGATGGGDQRMEYEWTNTPYVRAENSRMDGGGMEATAAYEGFTQQYGGAEGWDNVQTQRSVSQVYTPNMGPAAVAVSNQQVFGDVAAPMHSTGTIDSGMYAVGNATGEQDGATLQNQLLAAPHSLAGLEVVDESQFGPSQYLHDGQKLMTQKVDNATVKGGLRADTQITMGAGGGEHSAQQIQKSVHAALDKTKREALLKVQSAFNTALGGYEASPTQATRTRFSDKSGHLTDFMMPSGAIAGTGTRVTNGVQNLGAVTNLSTKREALYENQFGVKATNTDDGTVWLGEYRQSMEHLNERPEGNLTHLAATSGMAIGLRDDSEALAR